MYANYHMQTCSKVEWFFSFTAYCGESKYAHPVMRYTLQGKTSTPWRACSSGTKQTDYLSPKSLERLSAHFLDWPIIAPDIPPFSQNTLRFYITRRRFPIRPHRTHLLRHNESKCSFCRLFVMDLWISVPVWSPLRHPPFKCHLHDDDGDTDSFMSSAIH